MHNLEYRIYNIPCHNENTFRFWVEQDDHSCIHFPTSLVCQIRSHFSCAFPEDFPSRICLQGSGRLFVQLWSPLVPTGLSSLLPFAVVSLEMSRLVMQSFAKEKSNCRSCAWMCTGQHSFTNFPSSYLTLFNPVIMFLFYCIGVSAMEHMPNYTRGLLFKHYEVQGMSQLLAVSQRIFRIS